MTTRPPAVRIVNETGKSIAQAARELGINSSTLANWVTMDYKRRSGNGSLTEDETNRSVNPVHEQVTGLLHRLRGRAQHEQNTAPSGACGGPGALREARRAREAARSNPPVATPAGRAAPTIPMWNRGDIISDQALGGTIRFLQDDDRGRPQIGCPAVAMNPVPRLKTLSVRTSLR